jgi:Rrf2 family protein
MLLTKKACYGLIAVKHLAENAQKETSFSGRDLAELYGLPEETLAKTLQHLAKAGVLLSRQGVDGGYRLARDPKDITVLEVIKASEGARGLPATYVPPFPKTDPVRIVLQIVENALAQLTIARM